VGVDILREMFRVHPGACPRRADGILRAAGEKERGVGGIGARLGDNFDRHTDIGDQVFGTADGESVFHGAGEAFD
jgi:hypothetical protein